MASSSTPGSTRIESSSRCLTASCFDLSIDNWINDVAATFLSVLLLALAACGGGEDAPPPPTGPAPIGTFAYVMNDCEAAPGQGQGRIHQALWIRQGERDPVQIAEFTLATFPRSLCLQYSQGRWGGLSVLTGGFQRLGVTLDGSTVVFEVTDQFSLYRGFVPAQQKGFWVVRADGSGLHRIADASREASFAADWNCILFGGGNCVPNIDISLSPDFSPDGRQLVFTDRGPDTSGTQAAQVFTLDLTTGVRTQLTFLPPLPRCPEPVPPDAACVPVGLLPIKVPRFLDSQTVAFYRREGVNPLIPYTVDIETKELKPVQVVTIPGGGIVPVFQITGEPIGFTVSLPGSVAVNGGGIVSEAFAFDGKNLVQLTNFGRVDTGFTRTTLDGTRVLFEASADPMGTNPPDVCEYFSIDPLGGDLRQLTHFGANITAACGCGGFCVCPGELCAPPICNIGSSLGGEVDDGTGSLVFSSSCDPFGTNPYGEQEFAMRPDGTGLHQLTSARGLQEGADGSLAVELPGPWAIARRLR